MVSGQNEPQALPIPQLLGWRVSKTKDFTGFIERAWKWGVTGIPGTENNVLSSL